MQRVPELLSFLQVEVDSRPRRGRFILTGSANLSLLQSVSQSLAGRTAVVNLLPCGYEEVRRFPRFPRALFDVVTFENWVVTEILKACAHHGWHTGLFFLQDARGNEVDLLAEAGKRLAAVEIKSARTIAPDSLAGFDRLAEELDSARAGRELETVLVYGGDAAARRRATRIVPWHAVSRLSWG